MPTLLRNARPDHRYVVTSRSDMLGEANAVEQLERWSVELDADDYREGELARIYERRMDLLATDRQPMALDVQQRVLETLETPLELDLFFAGLRDGPLPEEKEYEFLERVLRRSHRDAVEEVVVGYLKASDDAGLSAVIWALLVARGQFDRSQLTAIQAKLRLAGFIGLSKLVDRLIGKRHLRQPARIVAFAHPSVRAGFEAFLRPDWDRQITALEGLATVLTDLPGGHRAWGLETAARVLHAVRLFLPSLDDGIIDPVILPAVQGAIDVWLEEALVDPASDFQSLLKLAAEVGSDASMPCEAARWFINGVRRGASHFLPNWRPPEFDDSWYARVSADPRSAVVAGRFIREQLPHDRGNYAGRFAEHLDRIATGLVPDYLAAAHDLVGSGHDHNVHVVSVGAVRDLDGYEAVLIEALDDLDAVANAYDEVAMERVRAIEDGELDEAYENYHEHGHDDEGYASGVLVDAYVAAMREAGRWRDLATHPRIHQLAQHWAGAIRRSPDIVSIEELAEMLDAAATAGVEQTGWQAVSEKWDSSLAARLDARLLPPPDDDALRGALVECALLRCPSRMAAALITLGNDPAALARLLVDMHDAVAHGRRELGKQLEEALLGVKPEAGEIFGSLGDTKSSDARPVGPYALDLLLRASQKCSAAVLDRIVPVMIASGMRPRDALRRWVVETTNRDAALRAAETVVALEDDELIDLALRHRRADARQAAMKHRLAKCGGPLPSELLAFASDAGSRVRRELVCTLASRTHPMHLSTLLVLAADTWSDAEPQYDELESFPIAREAVAAIGAYGPLGDDVGETLIRLAVRTPDRALARLAFTVAGEGCGHGIRASILDLSNDKDLRWKRVDALDALTDVSTIEHDIVSRITSDKLLRSAAPLAVAATALMATHLPVPEAVRELEALAHSSMRRSLLLVGAVALEKRDVDAARGLLNLLEPGHPTRRLLDLNGEKLPLSALNDLGDVRVRRHVRAYLGDRLAKQ